MIFALEKVEDCWDEVFENHKLHYAETESYHNQTLNPDVERYIDYCKRGFFFMFTARDKGELVGNAGMYLMPSMHTKELCATEDTWFLLPEYRKGRNAIRFYQYVEKELKKMGAVEITMSSKLNNKSGRIMEYLGYTLTAYQYSKSVQTAPPTSLKAVKENRHLLIKSASRA